MKKAKTKLKLILTLLIIIIILGAGITAFMVFSDKKGDKVIAKVNGEKIYQSELDERLGKMFHNSDQKISVNELPKQVLESLVQDLYLQRELDKIAAKSKVAKSKEVTKQIEDFKVAVIRQAYLDSMTKDQITDEAVKNKYSEVSSELSGKKEMHLRHILVDSEDSAKKVAELLKKKGASFAKIAKEYSKDTANSSNGGDLGYVIPDNLDEDFANAVKSLKKGQISGPIKTKYGWHIVKFEDIRDVELPAFESVKSTIADNLKQEILEGIFSKITKGAKVQILIEEKKVVEPKASDSAAKLENSAPSEAAPSEEAKVAGEVKEEAKSSETKAANEEPKK